MGEKSEVKSQTKVLADGSWPIPDWRVSAPELLDLDPDRLPQLRGALEKDGTSIGPSRPLVAPQHGLREVRFPFPGGTRTMRLKLTLPEHVLADLKLIPFATLDKHQRHVDRRSPGLFAARLDPSLG